MAARLGYRSPSGGIAAISSSPRSAPAAPLAPTHHWHRQACDNGATGTVKPSFTRIRCEVRPFLGARAPVEGGTFAPVLADERQAVAFRGPQPRERITPSISAPVDDCGHVDKAVVAVPAGGLGPASEMPGDERSDTPWRGEVASPVGSTLCHRNLPSLWRRRYLAATGSQSDAQLCPRNSARPLGHALAEAFPGRGLSSTVNSTFGTQFQRAEAVAVGTKRPRATKRASVKGQQPYGRIPLGRCH